MRRHPLVVVPISYSCLIIDFRPPCGTSVTAKLAREVDSYVEDCGAEEGHCRGEELGMLVLALGDKVGGTYIEEEAGEDGKQKAERILTDSEKKSY